MKNVAEMSKEELVAEVYRLRGIIERNRSNYEQLQTICQQQREELRRSNPFSNFKSRLDDLVDKAIK